MLDAIYATVVWGFVLGNGIPGVWQAVASGLLGINAYVGGHSTAALGLLLHFCISFLMALAYVRASRRLPVLLARPLLMGALYGVVLFVVMNFIVIPLSAIGYKAPSPWGFWRALLPHVVIVGPVIALIAAGRARRDSKPIS
jgi:uncharacterized membrane protein YagU involved in acid resistance